MRRFVLLAPAVLALATVGSVAVAGRVQATDTTVTVGNLYFCSSGFEGAVCDTSVNAGDTVTWQHLEGFHTVTQCGSGFAPCPLPSGFDSGQLSSGQFQQRFDQPGEYWYFCVFHPDQMRGRVLVAAVQPTSAPTTGAPSGQTQAVTPVNTGPAATTQSTPVAVPAGGGDPGGGHLASWAALGGLLLVLAAVTIAAAGVVRRR